MNNTYLRAQQLRKKEAKFPFVKIGSQYWTTKNLSLSVTPQGNAIPEMKANGNVEKITNIADREFSSDTGFWNKGAGWIISGGSLSFSNVLASAITKSAIQTIDKWYKITITASNITGLNVFGSAVYSNPLSERTITTGTKSYYLYATSTDFNISGTNNSTITIDNISIQEIGWAGSQELYDGIYAQTSGTVEQKTYAAVKAAAMWSNYNNDAPTGVIYGKLYNWFAVKLFQMDIDYYNAANPDKKWASGFRMPTQVEFQTLSTYLGGDAVSGGHLKEAGTTHWGSPNTGADNSSGFRGLGGGYMNGDGSFVWINQYSRFTVIDAGSIRMLLDTSSTNCAIGIAGTSSSGGSVRLIKS